MMTDLITKNTGEAMECDCYRGILCDTIIQHQDDYIIVRGINSLGVSWESSWSIKCYLRACDCDITPEQFLNCTNNKG